MAVLERIDDKRYAPRLETMAALTYFPFSSRKVPSRTARILNCSRGGISFLANHALKPGQTICLQTQISPQGSVAAQQAGALLKSFALAEVRWCVKVVGGRERYRIGVCYLQSRGAAKVSPPGHSVATSVGGPFVAASQPATALKRP
jgi:hypothetical protein